MPAQSKSSSRFGVSEITIALIGLLGVLATAVISNWDKLFSNRGVVSANYQGYRPTGNIETEIRYFYEITGGRKDYVDTQKQMINAMFDNLIAKNPKDAEQIISERDKALAIIQSIKFDEMLELAIPIYTKYFTIEEIQELNKFYSTELMQKLASKDPLITQDFLAVWMKFVLEKTGKIDREYKAKETTK